MVRENTLSERIILVIDDETSVLEAVRLTLEENYRILTSECASDALKCLSENMIDLALLDIRMPESDGIETLKRIKEEYPHTIILMMTAHIPHDTMRIAMDLGVSGFIVKPFDIYHLRKVVDRALSQY